MPVTKRENGSYQVTLGLGGGRTYRKTSRHWSHADAKAHERQVLAKLKDAAAGRQSDKLIADGLERFLLNHVPHLKSARETRNHARQLLPYIHGRKLTEIGSVWSEIKKAEIGKANATINHKGRILRQIGRMAWEEWNWIDRPPKVKMLPETPREVYLSIAEIERLAAAMTKEAAVGYLWLAAYTGIRRGHLLRLTHHDVINGCLRLDRSSKTRTLQMVPLHPKVKPLAARLPLPIGNRQLRDEWTAARKACGMEHVRWHDLRHTCASWLVQAGVSIYTVSEMLGHSSVAVTQRYAHLAPKDLVEAVGKLA